MEIPIYQIDAFASELFHGNPAAVCLLSSWLPDEIMQSVAAENNLSETAFMTGGDGYYELRWFTPRTEIDLCGHATLAAAFCVFSFLEPRLQRVTFYTKSGPLMVETKDDIIWMDFPSRPPEPCEAPAELYIGLMIKPDEIFRSRDFLAVYSKEEKVQDLSPRMDVLARCDCTGIIATAPGKNFDFVSRFFAPRVGVPEDPVTGSSHATLIPYWSKRLNKKELHACQISQRGGEIFCRDMGMRVRIGGRAVLYLQGTIHLPDSPQSGR